MNKTDNRNGNRRATDDKIFEMHGTISTLVERVEQIKESVSAVPENTNEINSLKKELADVKDDLEKVKKEQKIIEMTSAVFKALKYVAGLIIVVGAAWAVLTGAK